MTKRDKISRLLAIFNALNDDDKDIVLQLSESLKKKLENRNVAEKTRSVKHPRRETNKDADGKRLEYAQ